jgi:hypothetical protein
MSLALKMTILLAPQFQHLKLQASSVPTSTSLYTIKPRSSWIFRHMTNEDMQTKYYDNDGKEIWKCKYCPSTYLLSGRTSGPAKHVVGKHSLLAGDGPDARAKRIQSSLETAFAIAEANPQKRHRLDPPTIKQDVIAVLWVRAVAACNLPTRRLFRTTTASFDWRTILFISLYWQYILVAIQYEASLYWPIRYVKRSYCDNIVDPPYCPI